MKKIEDKLFELQDTKYRDFQVKLIPNIDSNTIIGVRTPELKKYAKELVKDNNYLEFINDLPHKYFDENQLHAFILSELKDYDECINFVNEFLPYVDNWATCDQLSPKSFKKNKDLLINEVNKWLKSKETYTIRFGIGVLMQHFLDDDFKPEYIEKVSKIKSNEYYVNMMIAWYFQVALTKQYKYAISYIENNRLDVWVHNKAIQKCLESYRISAKDKEYLRKLKRK